MTKMFQMHRMVLAVLAQLLLAWLISSYDIPIHSSHSYFAMLCQVYIIAIASAVLLNDATKCNNRCASCLVRSPVPVPLSSAAASTCRRVEQKR